jgi:hypothetical protein
MSSYIDFGFDASSSSAEQLADWLDSRVAEILADVEKSEIWSLVVGPGARPELTKAILREIYLEIVMYQPDSIEAAVASIAQFPRRMPVAWFDEMLHHQVEEFDHGEMALRDYVALGGNELDARKRPQSPGAFGVAAVWRNITHKRDPFVYLGAVYLFEALTPIVTTKAKAALQRSMRGDASGLEFIIHHATADLEHAATMRRLIIDVAKAYPDKIESIAYGFEYFAHVYPLPVWSNALRRARRLTAALPNTKTGDHPKQPAAVA